MTVPHFFLFQLVLMRTTPKYHWKVIATEKMRVMFGFVPTNFGGDNSISVIPPRGERDSLLQQGRPFYLNVTHAIYHSPGDPSALARFVDFGPVSFGAPIAPAVNSALARLKAANLSELTRVEQDELRYAPLTEPALPVPFDDHNVIVLSLNIWNFNGKWDERARALANVVNETNAGIVGMPLFEYHSQP